MLELFDGMRAFTIVSVLARLLMAGVFGAAVGLNPGRRHRPAGFRTYSVVCIGAASVMLLNQYLMLTTHVSDPARLGAQVISGIGFLGAGTILITGRSQSQRVKGLTTAAGLWSAACMGLCIGAGFYEGAILVLLLLLLLIAGLAKMDKSQIKMNTVQLYMEYDSERLHYADLLDIMQEEGWSMSALEMLAVNPSRPYMVIVDLHREEHYADKEQLLLRLRAVSGVFCAEEL